MRLPMQPEGTKSAASLPKISAARRSSLLTVGSSRYTSSPTSASAMARRMDGVGRVTVSLRKSTTGALIVVAQTDSDLGVWNQNGGGEGVAHPICPPQLIVSTTRQKR